MVRDAISGRTGHSSGQEKLLLKHNGGFGGGRCGSDVILMRIVGDISRGLIDGVKVPRGLRV